jgi:hypothetical protein
MIKALEIDLPTKFSVDVKTTNKRGFTPEEVAERCAERLISISDTAPNELKAQAHAFKRDIIRLLSFYMREAIKSDRTNLYNMLLESGEKDLAELIRRL